MIPPLTRTCVICEVALRPGATDRVCDDPRCRWGYDQLPPALLCPECGRPVAGDFTKVCVNRACRAERSGLQLQQIRERRAALEGWAVNLRDRAATTAGVTDPSTYPLVVIPSFDAALRPLPEDRRGRIAAHLAAIHAEALGLGEDYFPPTPPATLPPGAEALSGQACAACRGYCCEKGADHAYLNAGTAWRVLRDDPGLSAEAFVSAYLGAIGAVTYEGSCVYHGRGGCTLPRGLRSDTCNAYFCPPVTNLRQSLPPGGPFRAFLVSVEEDFRAAFVEEGHARPVTADAGRDAG